MDAGGIVAGDFTRGGSMIRQGMLFIGVCASLTVLSAGVARADVVSATVGAKAFAGGNLWTTPSNIPGGYDGIGFAGNGGGVGYGGGLYVEGRVLRFVGAEVGITYDSSVLERNVTITGTGSKITEKITTPSWRLPLLVKVILPLSPGRLSLGIGPEFVFAGTSSPSLSVTSGPGTGTSSNALSASTTNSTMLTTDLGFTLELPFGLELPIDLRASKNLSQQSDWEQRVSVSTANGTYSVNAQNSWDFRLSVGLGYRFY
jgi:hypothetical protein